MSQATATQSPPAEEGPRPGNTSPLAPASTLSLAKAPASEPLADARVWAWRALLVYALGLGATAAAFVPILLSGLGDLGAAPRLGSAVLDLLLGGLVALLLAVLGARIIQVGRAVQRPHAVPTPGRATLHAAQVAAALVGAVGLHHLVAGHAVHLGILDLGAAILGLLAAAAWASNAPGAMARASLLAVLAGAFWAAASLGSQQAIVPQADAGISGVVAAAFAIVLGPGAAVLLATLALLAFTILRRGPNRVLGYAGAAAAGLLAAIQTLVLALDFVGTWMDSVSGGSALRVAAVLIAFLAVLALLAASAFGIVASGYALGHYLPPLVARAGAGFLAPEPGAACPSCRLVPPYQARFCPDCGQAMPPPPSQAI